MDRNLVRRAAAGTAIVVLCCTAETACPAGGGGGAAKNPCGVVTTSDPETWCCQWFDGKGNQGKVLGRKAMEKHRNAGHIVKRIG